MIDAGMASDRVDNDERWAITLREEIEEAEVQLTTRLGRCNISLSTLLNLKPGDIVPCDFLGQVTLLAEDVPVFRGSFGLSHGLQAVKVEERVRRQTAVLNNDSLIAKRA